MITEKKITKKDALDKLKIVRYCCRRMFLCHVDVFDYISEFDKSNFSFIHDKIEDIKINQINDIDNNGDNDNVDDVDGGDIDIDTVDVDIEIDTDSVYDNFDDMY